MTSEINDMIPDATAKELILAFADDELRVGQNHSWWIAVGPFLEIGRAHV